MDGVDADAPAHKRPRLDSVNPVYNGHPPQHPNSAQPIRHPSHPTLVHASSTPPPRHFPPPGLPPHSFPQPPPPSQPYPPPPPPPHQPPHQPHHQAHPHQPHPPPPSQPQGGPYSLPQPPHQSPSLSRSDDRFLPRPVTSPAHRPYGLPGTPVTPHPVTQPSRDTIASYPPPPPTPQHTAPSEPPSRSTSVSASHDTKPPQGMEHGGPNSWPSHPDPHGSRHGSITNGYSSTMSPPNESHFQTQSVPQTPQYGTPTVPAYAGGPYMGQYGSAASAQMRRKQVRATQACNNCRSRKQKCDEARPCQFCRENNFDCQYKDVPPPKQDRSMMQLQDSVNSISDTLKSFIEGFNVWKQQVDARHTDGNGSSSNQPSPQYAFRAPNSTSEHHTPTMQGRMQLSRVNSMKTESPIATYAHMSPTASSSFQQANTPVKTESFSQPPPVTPADSAATPRTVQAVDAPMESEDTGLKSNHKTPAHHLFVQWPSMEKFCDGVEEVQQLLREGHKIEDYPSLLERDRGLLRIWGVGNQPPNNLIGSSIMGYRIDSGSPSAPTKDYLREYPVYYNHAPTANGDSFAETLISGQGPDGKPDFRYETLYALYESYMDNIHNLHPFLNPSQLRSMVDDFGDMYSPVPRSGSSATSPSGVPGRVNGGIKRKRSGSLYGDSRSVYNDVPTGIVERSLNNCIVLLVLALGKVCQHTKKLPAPYQDRSPTANGGSWNGDRASPHSSHGSFRSDTSSDRANMPVRNIDILPGMAYYAQASDILGNEMSGNTVAHAQAFLLAALYLGQYGRVLESWSWINTATRACLLLIKAEGSKVERSLDPANKHVPQMSAAEAHRVNVIRCVYWTTLQMESDILAEMSELEPSRVSHYQSRIGYPTGVWETFSGEEKNVQRDINDGQTEMMLYSSQIHLRVILNSVHNSIYGDRPLDITSIGGMVAASQQHAGAIKDWRATLLGDLRWNDTDPPSTNLDHARMRAKYYGALYVVLRPFVFRVIHNMNLLPTLTHGHSPAMEGNSASPMGHDAPLSEQQQTYLGIAIECIESAVQSTIAFDRVGADPDSPYDKYKSARRTRLIVPNIFGTLHAQFGNILVLTAVYNSSIRNYITKLLNKQVLTDLYDRTIAILAEMQDNSPTLRLDMLVLQALRKQQGL